MQRAALVAKRPMLFGHERFEHRSPLKVTPCFHDNGANIESNPLAAPVTADQGANSTLARDSTLQESNRRTFEMRLPIGNNILIHPLKHYKPTNLEDQLASCGHLRSSLPRLEVPQLTEGIHQQPAILASDLHIFALEALLLLLRLIPIEFPGDGGRGLLTSIDREHLRLAIARRIQPRDSSVSLFQHLELKFCSHAI